MPRTKRTKKQSEEYSEMSVTQLREVLKRKGLDTTGVKADLVERCSEAPSDDEPPKKVAKKTSKKDDDEDDEDDEAEEEEEEKKPKSKPSRKAAKTEDEEDTSVGKWTSDDTLLVLTSASVPNSDHIASFDMDDTIVTPKSGKVHSTGRTDWKWLYPEVPEKLKQLHKDGVKIVIFTNQGGINGKKGYDSAKASAIKGKILDLSKELGFTLQAFVATSDDHYRKPGTEMWDVMVRKYNGGIKPDESKCVYVGDAAGRAEGWSKGKKKDFACTDRKFAHNCGIKFSTPEPYFLGHKEAEFAWRGFNPASYAHDGAEITEGGVAKLTSSKQEMIVFVGFPASGKSTIAKTYLVPKGYVHVNMDTLKTAAKCLKVAQEAIDEGKSVVIDNTSPSAEKRAEYTSMAKEKGIPFRCFRFETDQEMANHLNYFRERTGGVKHVPSIAYNIYKKKLEEPTKKEGFTEIRKIKFVPTFADEQTKKEFNKFSADV